MCFITRWVCKIFKLDKIVAEYEEYVKTYEALKNYYEVGQPIIESYKNDLAESHAEERKDYNMQYIKKLICKIFKIDSLAKEYMELCQKYKVTNSLKESYRQQVEERDAYIKELEKVCTDPVSYVENALQESREAYEKCVANMEELLAKQDRLEHKAYARGRSDAYAEMGIKALDARLNGETLYVDENDNIIEDMDAETFEAFCKDNEIEIDDLIEERVD